VKTSESEKRNDVWNAKSNRNGWKANESETKEMQSNKQCGVEKAKKIMAKMAENGGNEKWLTKMTMKVSEMAAMKKRNEMTKSWRVMLTKILWLKKYSWPIYGDSSPMSQREAAIDW